MKFRPRRMPCRFWIKATMPGGEAEGTIIDVTERGARVEGISHLARGDLIRFNVLQIPVEAVVMWQSDPLTGIAFRQPLNQRQLDAIRKPVTVGARKQTRTVHTFTEL